MCLCKHTVLTKTWDEPNGRYKSISWVVSLCSLTSLNSSRTEHAGLFSWVRDCDIWLLQWLEAISLGVAEISILHWCGKHEINLEWYLHSTFHKSKIDFSVLIHHNGCQRSLKWLSVVSYFKSRGNLKPDSKSRVARFLRVWNLEFAFTRQPNSLSGNLLKVSIFM